MMKRLSMALIGLVCAGGIALAANISLITGAQDPSQLQAVVNNLIQTLNTTVSRIGVGATGVASSATSAEQTLFTYTLPASLMANPGDTLRIGCWGTTATNNDNKAMKLYFGSASITTPTAATSNKGWRLQMNVMRRTAGGQAVDSWGLVDTTAVTPANADGAEDLTAAVIIKCTTTTAGTASDVTGKGFLVEAIR
jgi:hypothetical protein